MTSLKPNVVNPLENREILKDWRLNIKFPPVNISKKKNWFTIKMAIPGLKKDNISIEVKNDVLIISGKKKVKTKKVTEDYIHQEYNYQSFKRSFSLPENVAIDKLESKYKKGILTVRLPKNKNVKVEK